MLDKGTISEVGTYDELISFNGAFAEFIRTYLTETAQEEDEDSDGEEHSMNCDNFPTMYNVSYGLLP